MRTRASCWVSTIPRITNRSLNYLLLLATLGFSHGSPGQTTPIAVDATQFPGADMCVKIQNARASSFCTSNLLGCRVFAPFTGVQACSVDPFSGWGSGGELDLRGPANLDVRASVTWHVPNGVHLIGEGTSGPTGPAVNSVNYFNTLIRAYNPNFMASNGNAAFGPVPDSITSITVAGTTATINANNGMCGSGSRGAYADLGQDVVILGGTGAPPFFAAYHGLAFGMSCSSGAAGSFQVQVPSGTLGCTMHCGSAFEGTPVIMMADIGLNAAQYRTQVEGIGIDCAWMPGCIPLLNSNSEEDSWFRNVNFYNPGGTEYARVTQVATAGPGEGGPQSGTGSRGGGAANSGPYFDFSGNLLSDICEIPGTGNTCPPSAPNVANGGNINEGTGLGGSAGNGVPVNPLNCETLGLLIDGPNTGTTVRNVTKDFGAFTLTINDPATAPSSGVPAAMASGASAACGTPYSSGSTAIGIVTYGALTSTHDAHIEYFPAEHEIGGNTSLNAAFPGIGPTGSISSPALTSGVFIYNENTCCGGVAGSSYEFDIGTNASDIALEAFSRFQTTNLVRNNVIANNAADCNSTVGDTSESFYFLGHGANPTVISSCTGINSQFSGPLTIPFAGASSQAGLTVSGAPATSGGSTCSSGSNCVPQLYINTAGAAAPSSFSTSGTMLGENAPSGLTGNLLDFHVNGGTSVYKVDSSGNVTANNIVYNNAPNTASSGMTLNMTAAGSNAFQVPSGTTVSANGAIAYDSSHGNMHIATNGSDSTAAAEASVIATNTIPKATNSTNALLAASSLTDNGTTVNTTEAISAASISVTGGVTGGTITGSGGITLSGSTFIVNGSGLPTKSDGVSLSGMGFPLIQCAALQQSVITATSVLSCTPASAAGSYHITFIWSIKTIGLGPGIGWTATWKDSNSNAQSPSNLSLYQAGTAAPALTFSAANGTNYYGDAWIDVDNSQTAIVIKTTLSGSLTTALASATVQRVQ